MKVAGFAMAIIGGASSMEFSNFMKNSSNNKMFWICIGVLMAAGSALFVLSTLLYAPFQNLVVAINSKENIPIRQWLASGTLTLLFGSFWLCIYITFEAAKKGLVDLIFQK